MTCILPGSSIHSCFKIIVVVKTVTIEICKFIFWGFAVVNKVRLLYNPNKTSFWLLSSHNSDEYSEMNLKSYLNVFIGSKYCSILTLLWVL